eukprot:CAMPEP_0201573970 /NCGR_PEP_ID=MMETSP0190_2-20130828/18121_1 /ASSEMBLY_ACC=CAM_ASM_000263 /TAXON_ID=37353 /ORGANISM="Rosalina sp." /LENGTH=538 /DNA_ID=CAMNT_0048001571 /DNA_START=29 /DNA_END=1645 /DNA_ORIENTATION=-
MATVATYIIQCLIKVLSIATHPLVHVDKFKYQMQYEKDVKQNIGKDLPLKELFYLIINDETVGLWDKIAACIDLQYPIDDLKYPMKDSPTEQEKALLRYAVKYAAYAYFMPIIGSPNNITIKKRCLPLFGYRAKRIAKPGYFIGIDDENQRIVLCIRGTETIGDTLSDLDAKPERRSFGMNHTGPYYDVHPGVFDAAKHLHETEKVTCTIKTLLAENEGYKVFVTGHSLGAGVCSLLGLIWKSQKTFADEQFKCFSFASPLVIGSAGVKQSIYGDNMISVAVTSDVVTRVSVKGMKQMSERIKIIKNTPNYEQICENIINSKCAKNGYLDEAELKLIKRLKETIGSEDNDLYAAGKLLWSVPVCVINEPNETEKYKRLLNRINFETSSISTFRLIQFIYDLICDFYVTDRNERLTELIGSVPNDRSIFTQMVFNGFESFHAHFPGRYTNGFDVNIVDVLKMSKYYQTIEDSRIKFKIPSYVIDILVVLAVLMLVGISAVFGIVIQFVTILGNVYETFIAAVDKFINGYKAYADHRKKE